MVSYNEATTEQITEILKSYIAPEHWKDNNFKVIISRAEEIPERYIVGFKLSGVDLYLDTRDLSYVDAHPYNNY